MNENDLIFWSWSIGLPALIVVRAYIAVRLHERSIDRSK